MKTIKGFKGFDKDLQCRGFQYEVGKDYEQEGEIKICQSGFHFYENPADVFAYYPPVDNNGNMNRYCKVEGCGTIDISPNDSKVTCSKLQVSTEIGINELIKAWVKFILDNVDCGNAKKSNTGDQSAATNTGYQSAAIVDGKDCIAIVTGKGGKAKGALGCWLVLTERDDDTYSILSVQAFKVDGELIKADTFYKLINGKAVEVKE